MASYKDDLSSFQSLFRVQNGTTIFFCVHFHVLHSAVCCANLIWVLEKCFFCTIFNIFAQGHHFADLLCQTVMGRPIMIHVHCNSALKCLIKQTYTCTALATGNVKMKRTCFRSKRVCFSSANMGVVFSLSLETRRKSLVSVYSWIIHGMLI